MKFSIKKIIYKEKKEIYLINLKTFKVYENTLEVQYLCNGLPIIRQFLLPFDKVKHILDSKFSKEVMEKDRYWYKNNIYVFISFTLKDNILLNKLPFTYSTGQEDVKDDEEYIDLFSITYSLGRKNVIHMYKAFLDLKNKHSINIDKICYSKIHRITNTSDTVNLIDFKKFINLLERGKK